MPEHAIYGSYTDGCAGIDVNVPIPHGKEQEAEEILRKFELAKRIKDSKCGPYSYQFSA